MNKNFTHKIKQLEQFELEPSSNIWNEIESQLPQERKRRIIGWWWNVPIVLLLGIGIFFIPKLSTHSKTNKETKEYKKEAIAQTDESNKINKIPSNSEASTNDSNEEKPIDINNNISNFTNKNLSNTSKKYSNESYKEIRKINSSISQIQSTKTSSLNNKKNNKKSSNKSTSSLESVIAQNQTDIQVPYLRKAIATVESLKKDTLKDKNEETKIKLLKDSLATNLVTKKTENSKCIKKLTFAINVFGGVNKCSEKFFSGFFNTSNSLSNSNSASGLSGGLPQPITNDLYLPSSGLNIGFGLKAGLILSKKSSVNFGLNYNYLQNNILVKNNSILNTYSPQDNTSTNTNIFKNYNHLIQLPISYQYHFSEKFYAKLGVSTELNIAQQQLVLNKNQGTFDIDKDKLNKLYFASEIGLGYNLKNKTSFCLSFKQYLTPVQKTEPNYNWQQLNLQYSLPLNLNK